MSESGAPFEIKELHESIYPGYTGSNGRTENLASYKLRPIMYKDDPGAYRSIDLHFDIEREFTWSQNYKLGPIGYSAMIAASYPINALDIFRHSVTPTMEEFKTKMETLPDFERDTTHDPESKIAPGIGFVNKKTGIVTNWTKYKAGFAGPRSEVVIGIVFLPRVNALSEITESVVPEIVRISNFLNPNRQISEEIAQEVIERAKRAASIKPRVRNH